MTKPEQTNRDLEPSRLDYAFKLIKYVNTPRRLIMLFLLIVSLIVCYTLWENRRELAFAAMSDFGAPQINEGTVDGAAVKLMADVGAMSVSVWSVNLNQNRRQAIYLRIGQNRLQYLEGTGDLALRPYSEHSADLIKVITEKTLCSKLIANTAVADAERKAGVNYVCQAAIPPGYGYMVGLLTTGFSQKPVNEDYIKMRMTQAAEAIIK
ncbi:hypothetical protein [Aeromonas hydrophila]|uniref:hypothetical protein n=1 Tax=Aeromonas hydrophila TaxID=644 RepID=UPI002B46A601|nr:hypothetical protein [Aeromonas hydrophila]